MTSLKEVGVVSLESNEQTAHFDDSSSTGVVNTIDVNNSESVENVPVQEYYELDLEMLEDMCSALEEPAVLINKEFKIVWMNEVLKKQKSGLKKFGNTPQLHECFSTGKLMKFVKSEENEKDFKNKNHENKIQKSRKQKTKITKTKNKNHKILYIPIRYGSEVLYVLAIIEQTFMPQKLKIKEVIKFKKLIKFKKIIKKVFVKSKPVIKKIILSDPKIKAKLIDKEKEHIIQQKELLVKKEEIASKEKEIMQIKENYADYLNSFLDSLEMPAILVDKNKIIVASNKYINNILKKTIKFNQSKIYFDKFLSEHKSKLKKYSYFKKNLGSKTAGFVYCFEKKD